MSLRQEKIKASIDFILNRLLIVFFFFILLVYSSREITDLDLWLHLKTGEVIVTGRHVPLSDIFSFSLYGNPWINHEWLFQLFLYLFYFFVGPDGLILMQNLVCIAIFLLLFSLGRKEDNHILVFTVLYLTLLSVAYRFTIRPDILSLFFVTLYLFVIKKYAASGSRSVWFLPLCQIFWVNMHGFSFLGPLLVVVLLAAEGLKRTVKLPYEWNQAQRLNDKQVRGLLGLLALFILVSVINPWGARGAFYPLSVLGQISGKGRVVFQYIQELARPVTLKNVFDLNHFLFYKGLVLISLFSFRFNQKNINVGDALLWLFFLIFSFLAIRNVAYFAIIAAYAIFSNFDLAISHKKELPFNLRPGRLRSLAVYACIGFLFYYPWVGTKKYLQESNYNFDTYTLKSGLWGISEQRYPKKAVDFLLSHAFPETMFNDFNSGAYLIGQTYPRRKVFIDGRTEFYGPGFFTDYVAVGEGKKDALEKMLERYDIRGFFLTNSVTDLHSGLLKYLFKDPLWKVVYFDDRALIFLKNIPENKPLIDRFALDLRQWVPPAADIVKIGIAFRYPWPNIHRARFLNLLGCYEAAAREAKAALDIMPNNAEAIKIMSDLAFEQKKYRESFVYARNALIYAPGDLRLRSRLALIYHGLSEEEKALKVIDAVIKKSPKYAEGYYVKALIVREKDKRKAAELAAQAVRLLPKEPKYHVLKGDLSAQAGDLSGAKKEWESALEYDSADGSLRKKLEESK